LVIQTRQDKRPLSSSRFLRRYERWRKGDNLVMMSSMDVLNKTYGVSSQPLVGLRSAGMNWVNNSALVKAYFNRYAMAYGTICPSWQKNKFAGKHRFLNLSIGQVCSFSN